MVALLSTTPVGFRIAFSFLMVGFKALGREGAGASVSIL
jgi:hypothetical protein